MPTYLPDTYLNCIRQSVRTACCTAVADSASVLACMLKQYLTHHHTSSVTVAQLGAVAH